MTTPKANDRRDTKNKGRSLKRKTQGEQNNNGLAMNDVGAKVVKIKTTGLHKNNTLKGQYQFEHLVMLVPALKQYVQLNPAGQKTINFSNPAAVKMLNRALLKQHFKVEYWQIPEGYLCPPIPGRADYIHRVATLLTAQTSEQASRSIRHLDIGAGANLIYPIVSACAYRWQVVGSDIDPISIRNAQHIIDKNEPLLGGIDMRLQPDPDSFFKNIILENERYDVTTCNPPFHQSQQDAMEGTARKIKNLSKHRKQTGSHTPCSRSNNNPKILNFGGQSNELWCEGGEGRFIRRLAQESRGFSSQVLWFTTLVSKKENVRPLQKQLVKLGAKRIEIHEMSQGQKKSRFVAWSFHTQLEQDSW